MRLPGVQSVDLQLALVKECYEDEKIRTLALVRTGIVGSADIEEFSKSNDSASQATNHVRAMLLNIIILSFMSVSFGKNCSFSGKRLSITECRPCLI